MGPRRDAGAARSLHTSRRTEEVGEGEKGRDVVLHLNAAGRIRIKRAYEERSPGDGRRVLVDRLWPRGVRKAELSDAVWMKAVAPSAALRTWFGHRPERWAEFRARYLGELRLNPAVDALRALVAAEGPVTLVYGARDPFHNQAVVLAEFLQGDSVGGDAGLAAAHTGASPPAARRTPDVKAGDDVEIPGADAARVQPSTRRTPP